MESGDRKFDADTLEKALAAVEKTDVTEEKDTPRAVIMAMYPRLQEVMAAKGMSVRQLYMALKEQMDLPISEKTFATYLLAAKKQIEGEKGRRGRKRKAEGSPAHNPDEGSPTLSKPKGQAPFETPEGSPTLSKPESDGGATSAADQADPREEPPAGANGAAEPADPKVAFEAHEAELDDDMAQLLAAQRAAKDGQAG